MREQTNREAYLEHRSDNLTQPESMILISSDRGEAAASNVGIASTDQVRGVVNPKVDVLIFAFYRPSGSCISGQRQAHTP